VLAEIEEQERVEAAEAAAAVVAVPAAAAVVVVVPAAAPVAVVVFHTAACTPKSLDTAFEWALGTVLVLRVLKIALWAWVLQIV